MVSQTKFGPGGGFDGVALHVHAHACWSHVKSGLGCGEPQFAGQSHAHVLALHVDAPLQPPQSAGQRYEHVVGSQISFGPWAVPSHVVVLHW